MVNVFNVIKEGCDKWMCDLYCISSRNTSCHFAFLMPLKWMILHSDSIHILCNNQQEYPPWYTQYPAGIYSSSFLTGYRIKLHQITISYLIIPVKEAGNEKLSYVFSRWRLAEQTELK